MNIFIPQNLASAILLFILIVPAWIFLAFLFQTEAKDVAGALGNVVGGIIGALGAALAVYFTFEGQRRDTKDSNDRLRKAFWNDVCCVQVHAFVEAQWWKKEMLDTRFGATQPRLLDHLESAVLENNLDRIGDIPARASDSLLVMRSGITAVKAMHNVFYDSEDVIIRMAKGGTMSKDDAVKAMNANKAKIFHGLCKVSTEARQAALILDEGGIFEKERRASFSEEEWSKREPEFREMNEFADAILDRRRKGIG